LQNEKPVDLGRLGLTRFPGTAEQSSQAITAAVHSYTKFKYDNNLWIGERPQGLVDAELAAEGKIRDQWEGGESAILAALEGKGIPAVKAEMQRQGIPTSETSRKAALRPLIQKDPAFQRALTTWRTTMTDLSVKEEIVNEARRHHGHVLYAWRQTQLLAYSAVDTQDKGRLQSIMEGVLD
jgi:hypothetical protein